MTEKKTRKVTVMLSESEYELFRSVAEVSSHGSISTLMRETLKKAIEFSDMTEDELEECRLEGASIGATVFTPKKKAEIETIFQAWENMRKVNEARKLNPDAYSHIGTNAGNGFTRLSLEELLSID